MVKVTTLKDVAKLAGVSVATVSRVVNGHKAVADETRARVEDAVRKLNYNPNSIARSLVTGRTDAILLYIVQEDPIVPTTWSYELPIIQGISDFLRGKSWELQIIMCSNREFQEPGFVNDKLDRRNVDGILVISAWTVERHVVSELKKRQIPYILVGCNDPDGKSPSFEYDNAAATKALVKHLRGLGHTTFGLIGGANDQLHMQDRLRGFEEALESSGLPLWNRLIKQGNWAVESGYSCMKELLSESPQPTAIVCGNDHIAVGAMQAIRESGAEVPRDYAVVGFDDTIVAQVATPKLTTVRAPLQEMGTMAVKALHRALTKPESWTPPKVVLPCEIVLREST